MWGGLKGNAIGFIAKKSVTAFAQIYCSSLLSVAVICRNQSHCRHDEGIVLASNSDLLLHGVCCLDDLELMKVSRRENMKVERATSFDSYDLKENIKKMVGQLLM